MGAVGESLNLAGTFSSVLPGDSVHYMAVAESTPDTVTEAVALLVSDGYDVDFRIAGGLRCGACSTAHDASEVAIERIYRFEGDSDPDDEAIVLGLSCPACGVRGSLVAAYGPTADPDEVAVISRLVDRRTR